MLVRFWNVQKDVVGTMYLNSEFLGKAKAVDIFYKFQACSPALVRTELYRFHRMVLTLIWHS